MARGKSLRPTTFYISIMLFIWRPGSQSPPLSLPRLPTQLRRQPPQVDRLNIALAWIGDATIVRAPGYVLELHPHGGGDRLAECDRLAVGDRGQEGDCAARRSAGRGANDPLVELVCEPHGEQGRALRQHGRIELRGTLRHDPKRGAVLAPLLGDASDRLAGRAEGLPA